MGLGYKLWVVLMHWQRVMEWEFRFETCENYETRIDGTLSNVGGNEEVAFWSLPLVRL